MQARHNNKNKMLMHKSAVALLSIAVSASAFGVTPNTISSTSSLSSSALLATVEVDSATKTLIPPSSLTTEDVPAQFEDNVYKTYG